MSALVAVSIAPSGVGASVGEYVAAAVRVLQAQDRVRWELGPMFTTLEGELEDVFELVLAMREAVFARGAVRVGVVLKVDERRDKAATLESKVERVQTLLASGGRPEERGPR